MGMLNFIYDLFFGPTNEEIQKTKELQQKQLLLEERRDKAAQEHLSLKQVNDGWTTCVAVRDLNVIEAEIESLKSRRGQLLKVEKSARMKIDDRLEQLQQELRFHPLDQEHLRLTIDFMNRPQWSQPDECTVPQFVMFDLENSECWLKCKTKLNKGERYVATYFSQPELYASCVPHKEMELKAHQRRCAKELGESLVFLSASFEGTLPDEVRNLLPGARKQFHNLYLICEAPNWQIINKIEPIPVASKYCMLIGELDDHFWSVCLFETESV